jgi:hypothetical protein
LVRKRGKAMNRVAWAVMLCFVSTFVYSQDSPSSGQNKGPRVIREYDEGAPAVSDVPSRVKKAVMKQLGIEPKKGGEIIEISAFCQDYPGGNELWSVSVSFRLYPNGPVMRLDTKVQTAQWDE